MIEALLRRYNAMRRKKIFSSAAFDAVKQYAVIGAGMHSVVNLYPVLHYFGIRLKYISTRSSNVQEDLSKLFPLATYINGIEAILSDPAVAGVFVCTEASQHFSILQQLFKAGKQVFVEKPPCSSLDQLRELIKVSQHQTCMVGLQRRYWPAVPRLKRRLTNTKTYNYQFYTGPYINGDVYTELLIHPIDFIQNLFGTFKILSKQVSQAKGVVNVQLHCRHENGISGFIDMVTAHDWNAPIERLMITTDKELLTVEYPRLVEGKLQPTRMLNIPAERILHQPSVTRQYFSIESLISPVREVNTLVIQGFYNELEEFIARVEKGTSTKNDLPQLVSVYGILDELRQ